MIDQEKCLHMNFYCHCNVGRLSEEEGGPVTGYHVDVTVKCSDCELLFRFIGLPAGNHYAEPHVSIDGTELRAPIEPALHQVFSPRASYQMPPRGRN